MPLRILMAGGLREPGAWDAYARALGEHLSRAGAGLSTFATSGFGRAAVDGFLKVAPEPAPGLVRAYPMEGASMPDALSRFAIEPLPPQLAGDAVEQALRESDALLIAGHGRGLKDLYAEAARRNLPVIPLPIEQATSEEIWEEALRHPQRALAPLELHQAFAALRRPDPRSQRSSEALAKLLLGAAKSQPVPTSPSVLLLAPPAPTAPDALAGMDDLRAVLRRALRAHAPAARVTEGAHGWLRSPGKALVDAIRAHDIVIVDVTSAVSGALYALGLARGADRRTLALAGRGAPLQVDPGAIDALPWETDRELAARLERRLAQAARGISARPPPSARREGQRPKKRRPRKQRARGPREPQGPSGGAPPPPPPPPSSDERAE